MRVGPDHREVAVGYLATVQVRRALEEAAKSDRSTVIDALIDPEVNLEVPVLSEMINGLWLKDCAEPFCGE